MSADPRAVRDVLAELEIAQQRDRERDAAGWVFVTVDLESGKLVHATGPFETPEGALIGAAGAAEDDGRLLEPGEVGWCYHVLALFAP